MYEINLIIESYNEKSEEDYKTQLVLNYSLANILSLFVSNRLSGKTIPSLKETYPNLFYNEIIQKEDKSDKSWIIFKERFIDFATQHNKKWGDKKNDDRRTESINNSLDR